jgi:hypothetical protein
LSYYLSSIGAGSRLDNLGDLRTGTDDALASRVVHVGDILVLELSTLPDLNFAATAKDTNTHGRQKVVGSVGVEVNTTVEDGSGILSDGGVDEGLATRVVLDKIGNIMDNTSNSNEALSSLGLGNEVIPVNDGELFKRNAPVEGSTLLVELLLELLNTALLNLFGTELLQLICKTKLLPEPDAPLGRVVLPPLNSVAVIRRKLVVEVVVTLTEGDKSGDDVITGRVAIIERLVAEPVGKRVDTEGSLLDETNTEDTGIDETTPPVTPAKTSNKSRESESHEENTLDVVLVLPDDNGVLVEIGDVSSALAFRVLLEDHPTHVRVHETLANRVGILLGIGISVVNTVTIGPPSDGALDGAGADGSEVNLKRSGTLVGGVRPHSVVTSSDTETSVDIVEDSPESGLQLERNPVGGDEANQGNKNNKCCVEPVDVLRPVAPGHRSVGNVRLVDILLGATGSERDIVLGAIRKWRGILARSSSCRHIDRVADGLLKLAVANVVDSI